MDGEQKFEDWFNETWPEPEMAAHEHKEVIKLAWNAAWRASRAPVLAEPEQCMFDSSRLRSPGGLPLSNWEQRQLRFRKENPEDGHGGVKS